jgi:putative DNA primase/helicase
MQSVSATAPAGATVRRVQTPQEHEDAAGWCKAAHPSRDVILAAVADAAQIEAPAPEAASKSQSDTLPDTATDAPPSYTLNDAGRAAQFVDNHLEEIRYVPAFGRWLLWAGHHWQRDEDGGITRLAVKHSQRLIADAATISNDAARASAVKEALAMGNAQRIERTLELAKCDRRVVVSHHTLDGNPFLLGVQNGVVELRTGTFRAGRRDDLITKRAGVSYVPGATCPRWLAFIAEVLADDPALVSYVQKLMGYTLTGDVSAQLFPFLFGIGKNGKSVFTETLHALLGEYGQRAPASLLTASANGREPTNEIARLHGARLVIGSETEEGARLAESRVKDLTGGDTLTGRFLYAEAFDFKPCLKLWMFGNHKPEIRGTDEGIWRRVRLIPFLVQIPEERRDPHLPAKLADELPGILQWAMDGARLWLADGLKSPPCVTEASAEYRDEEDTLADFIGDEIENDPAERTDTGSMFERYQAWAGRNGLRYPLTLRTLTKRLRERGLRCTRTHGQRHWQGVALK